MGLIFSPIEREHLRGKRSRRCLRPRVPQLVLFPPSYLNAEILEGGCTRKLPAGKRNQSVAIVPLTNFVFNFKQDENSVNLCVKIWFKSRRPLSSLPPILSCPITSTGIYKPSQERLHIPKSSATQTPPPPPTTPDNETRLRRQGVPPMSGREAG